MIQYPRNPAVAIIGAGAAGVGAGRELARLNIPFVILEAKDRIGGRAHSDATSLGALWDQGCHWFHSADINPLRDFAEEIGHPFQKHPRPFDGNTFVDGKWSSEPVRGKYVWPFLDKVVAEGSDGRDIAASTLIDASHPWAPMARHWLQLMYSADPEEISTRDAANYRDTGINLAVEGGYGRLIEILARGLPIRLASPAKRIVVRSKGVDVELADQTLSVGAVVLAVPARQIETGRLVIEPRSPDSVTEAFADVSMGWYEKIAFAFDRRVLEGFDPPYADVFDPVAPNTRPINFELHPFGRLIAVAHIAGSPARELAGAGDAALTDFALANLKRAFGADIEKRITKSTVTHWTNDPWIGGAYSCAKPGRAEARRAFSEPLHERVFLAGEHTHPHFFATAHGAYMSGQDAVRRAAGYPRLFLDI